MDEPESLLTERATSGDTAALTELLQRHAPRLRAEISIDARWRSVLEPDDVLQVTFIEAFLKIDRFVPAGPNALWAWLRRIAENNVRDAIKGLERQKRPPPAVQLAAPDGGDSGAVLLEQLGVTTTTPSRVAAGNEWKAALGAALDALPADYAGVIRAYDLEGHSIARTAEIMRRTPGAVHMLRTRAHARLTELLGSDSRFFSREE